MGDCPVGPPVGPSGCDPTHENTSRPVPIVRDCGPCICGEPSASQSQRSILLVLAPPSSSTLLWASLSECARALSSRDYRRSRIPWSDHSGGRGESARSSDGLFPRNRGAGSPLHHCGHLRSLRGVIVMVTGDLDEGRIGGFERQHALVCQICRVCHKGQLRGLSDSNARPDVHWLPAEASAVVALHREAAALETARKQHRELALARAVPTRPDVPVERQANQGRQQGQGNKGAKAEGGGATSDRVLIFRILAQLVLATVHGSSRDIKVGGPCCRIDVLFFPRNRVYEICRRGDRHSPFPSQLKAASDPDASQPAPSWAL